MCGSDPGVALRKSIKAVGARSSSFHFCLLLHRELSLSPGRRMSSYQQTCNYSRPSPCEATCPQPFANACSQPCVASCGDSRAIIYPPPVVITFPGPILSSCSQESIVGSSSPLALGSSFSLGSSQDVQSPSGSGVASGGRYSYSSYTRKTTYCPSKPRCDLPSTKTL
uniref:Keratin n=2 Tax=Anas TaxID=8835 RepID=A0A8C0A174_9AVES